MKFIEAKTIPGKWGSKKKFIQEFIDSGFKYAEVTEFQGTVQNTRACLQRVASRDFGDKVKVFTRDKRIFFERL